MLFPYKKTFSHWHAHLRGFVGETFELFQRERFRFPCQLLLVLDTLRISWYFLCNSEQWYLDFY